MDKMTRLSNALTHLNKALRYKHVAQAVLRWSDKTRRYDIIVVSVRSHMDIEVMKEAMWAGFMKGISEVIVVGQGWKMHWWNTDERAGID